MKIRHIRFYHHRQFWSNLSLGTFLHGRRLLFVRMLAQTTNRLNFALTFWLFVRETKHDRYGTGGRLALNHCSRGDGPVVAHDVIRRPAIAPCSVSIGLHPGQKLGAAAFIDEQLHVTDKDPLECAAVALAFTSQDILISDTEVGFGPLGRFNRIVEVCLVVGLLIKQDGGADEGTLVVSQRESANPSSLPGIIIADTVKDFAGAVSQRFFLPCVEAFSLFQIGSILEEDGKPYGCNDRRAVEATILGSPLVDLIEASAQLVVQVIIINIVKTDFRFIQVAFIVGDLISPRTGDGPPHDVVIVFVAGSIRVLRDETVIELIDLTLDVSAARAVVLIHHCFPELRRKPEIGFRRPLLFLAEEFAGGVPVDFVQRAEGGIRLR
jgi:hypothetical protein